MAVETVASVVIEKLTDILTEESISNEKVIKDQLAAIKKALEEMRGYFLDAEDKHRNDENVKKWAEDYLTNLYKVEDTIESFALRIARQRMRLGFLMNHALFLKNCTACRMLSGKIKKIRIKIENLNSRRPKGVEDASNKFPMSQKGGSSQLHLLPNWSMSYFRSVSDASINRDRYKQAKLMYSYSYYEEELDFVGFKGEVHTLVTRLTDESIDARDIVSIVGKMGSGKTTLARAVYGNTKIKQSFKCCSWVNVSKEYDAISLLRNLLKHFGSPDDQDLLFDEQFLKKRLFERLKERKYLIVLDDLWSSHIWDDLKDAFPNNKNGSKIILVTSEDQVAVYANSPFRVQKLSDKDSWNLFLKKAGWDLPWESVGPENVMPRILQACNCLPLNIVLLGSFLSVKKEASYQFLEKLYNRGSWETNEILSLCYNDLPDSLKLCLLYMLLFPPELDIPVRRLLRLWQAEGFLNRPDKTKNFPEDVAQEYFDNLVNRSLIQVSKLRSDGSPRRCRLLGVLRDYLLPKALGVSLFHVHRKNSNACEGKSSFDVRRLIEYRDINHCPFYLSRRRECLRSFLSFNGQKKDTPAKEVGNLLRKIVSNGTPLLRVLDLEGLYKPSLPENLGDLFNLRYLGLRWTFLESLPQSVGDLYYLETLDVKHTCINTLPKSIWKLKHLRHLNLNEIRLDVPGHMLSSLPQLLTLWGLSLDQESLVKGCLDSLVCLRELGITFHLSNSDQLLDWISKLKSLQQLRLRSKDDVGNPSNLVFKPLSELNQLSHLYLLGNLEQLPEKQDFPQGIKVLTLSVSCLKDDPMPILGQLPSLTVLKLLAKSYLGEKIICRERGFRQLQVLKLWSLENLEEWDLKEGAMERLKELNIRCCKRLTYIPSRLLQQRRFKELTLTNMPEELREQVEREKSHHIYVTVKDYFK